MKYSGDWKGTAFWSWYPRGKPCGGWWHVLVSAAERWRQEVSSELDAHLFHAMWNMSSHLSLLSSSWHPYWFKSYSINLEKSDFCVLTLLKLGGIFQKMKNGHRVGHYIVSHTHGYFSATAAGMVEWHHPCKLSLKGLLEGGLTGVVQKLSAGPHDQIKGPRHQNHSSDGRGGKKIPEVNAEPCAL